MASHPPKSIVHYCVGWILHRKPPGWPLTVEKLRCITVLAGSRIKRTQGSQLPYKAYRKLPCCVNPVLEITVVVGSPTKSPSGWPVFIQNVSCITVVAESSAEHHRCGRMKYQNPKSPPGWLDTIQKLPCTTVVAGSGTKITMVAESRTKNHCRGWNPYNSLLRVAS